MADNYLEKRQDALASSGRTVLRRNTASLDTLLLRNRSHRGFDASYRVHMLQLRAIISVNTKVASGRNAQTLRFKPVDDRTSGCGTLAHIPVGGFLPELGLPAEGSRPGAFIVVFGTVPETPTVDIDLGISLQSMGLKAAELGLNVLIIRAFDRQKVKEALGVSLEPLAVLAVGKGTDNIKLVPVKKGVALCYYREDGVHFVPKLVEDDIII